MHVMQKRRFLGAIEEGRARMCITCITNTTGLVSAYVSVLCRACITLCGGEMHHERQTYDSRLRSFFRAIAA